MNPDIRHPVVDPTPGSVGLFLIETLVDPPVSPPFIPLMGLKFLVIETSIVKHQTKIMNEDTILFPSSVPMTQEQR